MQALLAAVLVLLGASSFLHQAVEARSIDACGAIANNNTYAAAWQNGKAFYTCAQLANRADSQGDRSVVIPAGSSYEFLPFANLDGLHNVTIDLRGTIHAFQGELWLWPNMSNGRAMSVIDIERSSGIRLIGNGTINGHGFRWWVYVLQTTNDNRPHLVRMISCIDTLFEGWTLLDSPMYHVKWVDMLGGLVQHVRVHVDVEAQKGLLRQHGKLADGGWPTFPLNTDGIDVRGRHIIVRNCHVENFDDSLCVKPMNGDGNLTQCSEDILFEDSRVHFGVGASVGSVGPSSAVSCVRNTTFRNIHFRTPLKGIYVKPNPGNSGSGIVDRITYENIYMEEALWWTIWVSTQQQHQPGNGADTGSFFYPLPGTKCPLQPRVPVTNLHLKNVTSHGAWLSPGILRCSPEGPCTGWLFEDVTITTKSGFPMGPHFLCEGLVNATFSNVNVNCTNHTWLS